jgi:pyruvate/2-oxoglutarate dehydrogenase complex dihydrolipoamide acyltransferase (E2) component
MPLFSRSDGTLVKDLPRVRRVMPYLMQGRNESMVLHETVYDLSRAGDWLERYNRQRGERATVFHLLVYAFARALHERPGLNRFVSGGRIYQRDRVTISFAAKYAFDDHAPFVTVKLEIPFSDDFPALVSRSRW